MSGILRYVMRRLGFYAIAAWGAITLNFFLPRMMPGDPASTLFGRFKGRMEPEALERLQELLGYGEGSIFVQYLSLIHISEPTRLALISYAVFCLKKKKTK